MRATVIHGTRDVRSKQVPAMFGRSVGVVGGVAPVRAYLPEPLAEVGEAYAAMDERRAIKTLLRP